MSEVNEKLPLPPFYVGKAISDDRKNRYLDMKYRAACDAAGKPDTKFIWYSREHLATLLSEIDQIGGNGINFHFGVYEPGHDFENQTCLIMNITRLESHNGNTTCRELVLEEEPEYEIRSKQTKSFGNYHKGDDDKPEKPKDFNWGAPCPPRCSGGGTGGDGVSEGECSSGTGG